MLALTALVAHAATLDPKLVAEVAKAANQPVVAVEAQLEGLTRDDTVLERMAKPWEAKPWPEYRALFLTEERIEKGRAFAAEHAAVLARAERTYGVPSNVVLAILGVETRYGEQMGADQVATALYTLGFHHQRRGPFFCAELGHFLRLAKREGWGLTERVGSYAGAMGMGQFMPSSYLEYAVDFDEDGATDLFGSPADAIGSVANYLARHGWEKGAPMLLEATRKPNAAAKVRKGLALDTTVGALLRSGVTLNEPVATTTRAKLLNFDTEAGSEVRVALQNFYVITRYNRSSLYARAVAELAAAY